MKIYYPHFFFFYIILCFFLWIICPLPSTAQSYGGIRFYEGNWFEVLNKAQEEGKFIFVDAYADYCRPCKEMDKTVFMNQEVALLHNKNFINYKLDVEDVTNHQFKEKYGVKQLPTFLYFTSSGELVKTAMGAQATFDFLLLGKQVVDDVATAFLNNGTTGYGMPMNPMNPTPIEDVPNYGAISTKNKNLYEKNMPAFPTASNNTTYPPPTNYQEAPAYPAPPRISPLRSNPTPTPDLPFKNLKQQASQTASDYPSVIQAAHQEQVVAHPNKLNVIPETALGFSSGSLVKNYNMETNEAAYHELQQLQGLYEQGNRHPQLLNKYSYLLKRHYQPYNLVVNEYLATQQQQMNHKENLQFIYDFSINLENDAINLFLYNLSYFKTQYSGKVINEKVQNAVYQSIITAIRGRYNELYIKAMLVIQQAKLPNEDQFIFEVQSFYYQGINDWERYAEIATDYLTQKEISDPQLLNNVGVYFYNFVHGKKMLKRAIKWVEQSIRIESEHYNHHTLALLYYKLKNFKKAQKVAEKAVQIAQLRKEEDKETRKLLDNLSKM